MKRLLTTLAAALIATSAVAGPFDDLTSADRDALGSEIRQYLLENPQVLMEVIAVLESQQQGAKDQADAAAIADNREALENDGYSFVAGNPDGDITIIEFLDYQCGFCKRAHPEVAELLASDGNIRLIQKEFPILGPMSEVASRAAIAVLLNDGAEVYAAFSDRLMSHDGALNEGVIVAFARASGADVDAMQTGSASDEVTRILNANHALGRTLEISGTPTFVVVDEMVRGYLPLEQMQKMIASKRAEM